MTLMDKHNVLEFSSSSDFNQLSSHSIFNFYASWHTPCVSMNQVFAESSKKFPSLTHVQVSAEDFPDLSEEYEISSVPTFIVFVNGKAVERMEGANPQSLSLLVQKFSHQTVAPSPPTTIKNSTDSLQKKLKNLVESFPLMIFIKGSPSAPQCGFSSQLIALLNEYNLTFGSFDILKDEQVRQGLKEYSDWPTFPQVYIQGEFVGGLDIVKESIASGEFMRMVPNEAKDLKSRLKSLISSAPVMLFMKGSPSAPQCGFSRTIVSLLQENGIAFETFDILSDNDVRQGLKDYSDWPTFPQLYIHDELVGGLDIVKELIASGELMSLLNK